MKRLIIPLSWSAISISFGLLQLWVVLLWILFDADKTLNSWKVLSDCGLLFFSTSIMVTIALDYFIKGRAKDNTAAITALYLIPPIIVLIISILIYGVVYFSKPDINLVIISQFIIISFCVIFISSVKYLEFNNIIK